MTATRSPAPPTVLAPARLAGLARWNVALAVLHAAQAVAVLGLASSFAITLTASFPTGPPGSAVPAPEPLLDVRVGIAVAVFLGLAAVDHLLTGTVARGRYERDLQRGLNRFRWVEYSFSATLMVLLVATYSGITGISALIGIAGANVAMVLFGWLQELMPPGRATTTMLPFWMGSLVGLTPWVAISANLAGSDTVPGFVYGIFVSLFVFFASFAVNQWLQFRRIGRWADPAFAERGYLVLSLAAKSALAWQVFAGSLAV